MMKVRVSIESLAATVAALLLAAAVIVAQTADKSPNVAANTKPNTSDKKEKKSDKDKKTPIPAPTVEQGAQDPTTDGKAEEDAILPYYDNYLKEYRLGPSDVISVEVFGQCPDYCISGKPIPPNARISYPLIREGVMVAGKTVEQVAAEITKKLDEFIIDPKVTVTLEKANATRFSVMGNVATPGVRVMDRKVSVYEAILDAGGVTKNGDKKKVAVVSYGKGGLLTKKVVSLADMEAGKAPMVYLNPGDQVFVAGKGFSLEKAFEILGRASTVRYMMGSPF
jgi:polysaccharide export outer membrane protein